MNGEGNCQLVPDELVELQKWLVRTPNFMKTTHQFNEIYGMYLKVKPEEKPKDRHM